MALSPASIGIILDSSQTKVLLVKRADVPVWVLPGGGIDKNETAEKAVVREVEEETGFQVKIERQTAHYLPTNTLTSHTYIFLCQIQSGSLRLSAESKDIRFYPISELPKTLFPPHKQWLQEALVSNHIIIRPLYEISYCAFLKLAMRYPLWILRYLWTRLTKK